MKSYYHKTPNKNFRARPWEDVTMGIVHYTGSMSFRGTVDWFLRPESKVSAHYVIGQDGRVDAFEDYTTILWHAGRSEWGGRKRCNKFSIGYELVGTADSGFTRTQMDMLSTLIHGDMIVCPNLKTIVGHEHVSPGRKVDPGQKFNWEALGYDLRDTSVEQIGLLRFPPIREDHVASAIVALSSHEMSPGKDDPWWKFW